MTIYYTIYKTIDSRNGKIYVGKHKTKNLNDGYLGSGKIISAIIGKYRVNILAKEILMFCESEEEMNEIEYLLVDPSFISRPDTYNIAIGGSGGSNTWQIMQAGSEKAHLNALKAAQTLKSDPVKLLARNEKISIAKTKWNQNNPEYLLTYGEHMSNILTGRRKETHSGPKKQGDWMRSEAAKDMHARGAKTRSENARLRREANPKPPKIKKDMSGENSHRSKLTDNERMIIKMRFNNGECRQDIYKDFADKIAIGTLNRIIRS